MKTGSQSREISDADTNKNSHLKWGDKKVTPQKEPNEIQASNPSDIEFKKKMVTWMLKELSENYKKLSKNYGSMIKDIETMGKNQEGMKYRVSEMKNTLEGIKRRLD